MCRDINDYFTFVKDEVYNSIAEAYGVLWRDTDVSTLIPDNRK